MPTAPSDAPSFVRRLVILTAALSVWGTISVVSTSPVQAQSTEPDVAPQGECELSASEPREVDTEEGAHEAALACGVEVEVLDERTEYGEVFALPDGSMRMTTGVEPVRAIDDSGEWAPIDTTLEFASDGSVRPVNVAVDLEFSGGGTDPMAQLRADAGGTVGIAWSESLPAPILDGNTAVYAEVYPDVDLVASPADRFPSRSGRTLFASRC